MTRTEGNVLLIGGTALLGLFVYQKLVQWWNEQTQRYDPSAALDRAGQAWTGATGTTPATGLALTAAGPLGIAALYNGAAANYLVNAVPSQGSTAAFGATDPQLQSMFDSGQYP